MWGGSWGVTLAVAYAEQFPERVSEMVLVAWEDAVVSMEDGWAPNPRYRDAAFRMTFARLCARYFSHAAWLEDGQLLRDAGRLAGIPAVLIHGRFDIGGPPDVAWLLARAWPGAELHLVRTGHQGGDEMTGRMLEAIERFAQEKGAD